MPRSTFSVPSRQYRKKVLKKLAKGMQGRNKNCFSVAIQKVEKGLSYAYRDRKVKKRYFRSLWIERINAEVRKFNITYSVFMNLLKRKGVLINRKVLSFMASEDSNGFEMLVKTATAK